MRCEGKMGPKRLIDLVTLVLCAVCMGSSAVNAQWHKITGGINESGVNVMMIHPHNKDIIFAGTDKGLYVSQNSGVDFRAVIDVQGQRNKVHALYAPAEDADQFLAATDSGLYRANIREGRWQKIYDAGSETAQMCLSVVRLDSTIFLGTADGLFLKQQGQGTWKRVAHALGHDVIYALERDERFVYAATGSELYRLSAAGEIKKIFTVFSNDEESDDDYEQIQWPTSKIKGLFVLQAGRPVIYLCQADKIFTSANHGATWQRLTTNGQVPGGINDILVGQDMCHGIEASGHDAPGVSCGGLIIFLATDKGVFKYQRNRWQPLYRGLDNPKAHALGTDLTRRLYAATAGGLFFMPLEKAVAVENIAIPDMDGLAARFAHEPSIQEVHRFASRYAEVNKEKIDTWRRQAARKPWLPDVSIGLGADKNRTTSDSVYGSYSSGGQHYLAPDDKTFYDNFGWDVSLSWDLGDIIWNSDQTSIDSRSKMMVELREDILDQVTRLYFERRRLQVEMGALAGADASTVFDRKLRIDELTALIDALTGGEFTKRIEHNAGSQETER